MLYSFFFVRKFVAHVVPFMLYCVVIPLSVLIPEVSVPVWGVVYVPTTITLLHAVRSPRLCHPEELVNVIVVVTCRICGLPNKF